MNTTLLVRAVPLGIVGVLAFTVPARCDWSVWTVKETVRFLRSAPAPGGAQRAVELSAARNEWESFQVLTRADEPVKGVNVVPGDLTGR